MADAETPTISSDFNFTESDLQEIEQEFEAPPEETEDEPEDEGEEGEAEEAEDDEEEEEGEVKEGEEGKEKDDLEEGEQASDEGKKSEKSDEGDETTGKSDEKTKGYELLVDGQPVLVDTEEELAAWAQKGIHYEKNRAQNEKQVEDATFTMNALINDPMASLEEIWTARYGGNHEQARQHIAKVCETYLEPIWKELVAEPAQRLKLQEDRFTKRAQQNQKQQQQAAEGQFSQEDIQFIQTMDAQITGALEAVDLPKENTTLRKWMADVMREGVDRGINPDPRAAAEFIKSQQQQRTEALGDSAPAKDRKKAKAKKIAKAKARRSQRQGGDPSAPQGKRQEPQYISTREWLDGLNNDLNLEP